MLQEGLVDNGFDALKDVEAVEEFLPQHKGPRPKAQELVLGALA